jgi:hypothetical protein
MSATAHQARQHHPPSLDISTATVRPIPLSEARAIIEQHEYLGTMPAVARWAFGIFFGERCGGAVIYGDEYAENRGYGFTGRIIGLLRGACLPWAHPHAASKLIRRSMDLLPERYKVITAMLCRSGRNRDHLPSRRLRLPRPDVPWHPRADPLRRQDHLRAAGKAKVRHMRQTCSRQARHPRASGAPSVALFRLSR